MSKKFGTSLEFAKRYVSEKTLQQLLNYLSKDPVNNLDRIFTLGKILARREEHKQAILTVERNLNNYPAIRQLVESLLRDTHPNVRQRLLFNFFINSIIFGIPKQLQLSETLGFKVPHTILVDPTSNCNLRCEGCWAGAYAKHDELEYERLDRLFNEAKELGIYWIVMSGGEPFMYPYLFDLAAKHNDMAFMIYTNGTRIDEKTADKIIEVGNISPAFSLEGWEERTDRRRGTGVFKKVINAMEMLRERGAVFGISLTATRENVEEIMSDEFIDYMIDKGAKYGWIFHYIPIGRNPNTDLMLTPEQRAYLAKVVPNIRRNKPIFLADFWNDGEFTQGCIAGGKYYFHITASGAVEPCAFVHISTHNINECSLKDVLNSPLFKAYQKRQPFNNNHLRPCPIIDVPSALREIVTETGAKPTHPGADDILKGEVSEYLDRLSEAWAEVAAEIKER
ncbi:radical SAM protein [Carboxydothermus hydrogenoformans]|uniref:Radical SAM domain protein n=1 Tax=Carboxydothermus hydrogenoformans (strain ATCC BAA-161 / DSM 6008 / Z-2901) TaxID=246194 RepID=Q3ADN9_CARHZ|nr:radical SAM protein [Carboxydothermus hydrogenoformans]ABB14043.1 radical SAM domain protein [Carboxydothermus hydrogenoformans Z-2901]